MARTVVRLNHIGMRQLLKSNGVEADLRRRAEQVAAAAKSDPHDETGAYEASIHVVTEQHPTRVVAHVVVGDFKGHILEARYGILARALDSAR